MQDFDYDVVRLQKDGREELKYFDRIQDAIDYMRSQKQRWGNTYMKLGMRYTTSMGEERYTRITEWRR